MSVKWKDLSPEAQQQVREANPDLMPAEVETPPNQVPIDKNLVRLFMAWIALVSIPIVAVLVVAAVLMGWKGALALLCLFWLIRRW